MLKRVRAVLIYILVLITGVFLLGEAFYRFQNSEISIDKAASPISAAMKLFVQPRINKLWNEGKNNPRPFFPPFNLYKNIGEDNFDRLRQIADLSRLETNKTWLVPNFLRAPGEAVETLYEVTSNNLGYRNTKGLEEKKKAKTIRIFALGSYPTFGHGVSDKSTYSFQLEKLLNELDKANYKYEVWNGGRQAATAIMGLARLKTEIVDYDPDLIIWDFGWVDLLVKNDYLPFENSSAPLLIRLRRSMGSLWYYLTRKSILLRKYHLLARDHDKNLQFWKNINLEMLKFTEQKKWPVILLHQSGAPVAAKNYHEVVNGFSHAAFIDVEPLLTTTLPNKNYIDDFWRVKNWLTELDLKEPDLFTRPELVNRGDAIHLSPGGHRLIAEALLPKVKKVLKIE